MGTIKKLYISNFLTGLVFWYGIEKLFMKSIGIDAVGIGIAAAAVVGFDLVFDIPAGMLADKWSRKYVLALSAVCSAVSSLVLGLSHGLPLYLVGYVAYGFYIVFTSGIYQAIIYDVLHEEGGADEYSKVMGRAYALFLVGAAAANIVSGVIVHFSSLRWPYFASIIPAVMNAALLLTIHEPTFHKAEHKENMLHQLGVATRMIMSYAVMRSLVVVFAVFNAVEIFKTDFSQLYMLKFTNSAIVLGILWAIYALTWAFGSFIAHRVQERLSLLIVLSCLTLLVLGTTTAWWGLVVFMVQAIAGGAAFNLIEMHIQHVTPSSVRASVISVMYTLGRVVSLPASLFFGWIIREHNVFWALRSIALLAAAIVAYWLIVGKSRLYHHTVVTEPISKSRS